MRGRGDVQAPIALRRRHILPVTFSAHLTCLVMSSEELPYVESWLSGPEEHRFYTRTYAATETARAVVVFIHGFAEHVGRHEHAHRHWQTKDLTVFTFDQRGFGQTALDAGRKSKDAAYGKVTFEHQMRDIDFWVRHVKTQYPDLPIFLVGQSMVSTVCPSRMLCS